MGDVFDLIFFGVFNDQHDQVAIESLLDLLDLIVAEQFEVLGADVGVHVEFGDLVFVDHGFISDGGFGLFLLEEKGAALFFGFAFDQVEVDFNLLIAEVLHGVSVFVIIFVFFQNSLQSLYLVIGAFG